MLPPRVEASHLGSSTASAGSVPPPSVAAIQSFQPDLFTGRATTSIPMAVPPGRKGMQPSLGLTYSSSARNGWVGVGWNLDLGYIERSTKNGPPRYDSTDTYTFMFQGVASDLVKIPDGTYRAKDEGLFLRFQNNGAPNGWEVRDKSGTRYLLGGSADSEQGVAGNTFRWGLRKVLDTNGNFLTVTYTSDQGQLYPARIDYTGHETSGLQDLAPANYVVFATESRPDTDVSLRSGAEVRTVLRLKEVAAYAQGQLARRYVLTYAPSGRTGRSLLASVTQLGHDGLTSLLPTTFTYQSAQAPSYQLASNAGAGSSSIWNVRAAGLDTGHENNLPCNPFLSVPWSSPVVQASGSIGSVSFSSGSDGSFTVSFPQDNFFHAWTWVYNTSAVTIPTFGADVGCMWIEDGQGLRYVSSQSSVSLNPGWTAVHLTGYHQHEGRTMSYAYSLKNAVTIMNPSQFIKPQLAGDMDGNGVTDLVKFDAVNGTWSVGLSHSASFAPEAAWLSSFGTSASIPLLGDWNGDGRTDISIYNAGIWRFAASTGAAFQADSIPSFSFGSGTPLTGDFNGDGFVDLGTYNNGSWSVALGNGSGFAGTSSFNFSLGDSTHDPLTGDFNGDGFTDLGVVSKASGDVRIALSNGASLTPATVWLAGFGAGQSHTSADFNGDGLTDAAYYNKATGQAMIALSTGLALGSPAALPVTFSQRSSDDGLQVGDFNGDGLADPAVFNTITGASELARSQGTSVDLLGGINNGLGGTTAITYQPSTACDNTCPIEGVPKLPFILPVVNAITISNGLGHSIISTYVFRQGRYDAPTREFRGFGQVEVRNADATAAVTTFHQDEVKKGRPSAIEVRDRFDNLWSRQEQTWSSTEPYPGVRVVRLDQTDAYVYDGDATFRQTRSRFTYDQYGNITRADADGEVGVLGDERSGITTYVTNESAWILGKPTLVQTLDAAGTVVAQRRFSYDGAFDHLTPPTRGNLTKEEEWLSLPSVAWLATSLTYDAYGNVKTVTDAATPPRTTTNTYDSQGTYLTQIANTLGHTRSMTYDARLGVVLTSADQNNVTTTTEYDALGRVTRVIGPNDTAALPTVRYEYDLSAVPAKTTVHTRIQSAQPGVLTVHTFTDGLGRTLQTRSPAEDPLKQVVTGAFELNAKGHVIKQWAPYLEDASTVYVSVSSPAPRPAPLAPPVTYTYDPVGRLLTTTDPDGATGSTAYDDWSVTSTDANGHQTRRASDAYGRLVKVEEFIAGQTATTTYAYDALDNLIRVTDAAGNLTQIAYDSLGRKLSMDDPDMGVWAYAYDAVDNLTSQTDARGITTTFTYDALNRLKQKSYTIPGGSGIASPGTVTYTYDDASKPFRKGKLSGITDGAGSSAFEYDNLGRLTKETKTIDSTPYTVQRSYDLLGRLATLTYPDSEVVSYTYNPAGGIETIVGSAPYVTNVEYNAAGQMTKIVYGNGAVSDYSYDPQTLRLNRLTTDGAAGRLQDFSYAFDPAGNVTQITDAIHTGTQSFQYDDLHRLTLADGVSYGAKTYAYNAIGNMVEKEGVTMTYGAGAAGPHAVTATSAGLALTYDANGNMVSKRPADQPLLEQMLAYDAENRLVDVQTAQDAEVDVTFQPGWNFFSLPVLPADGAVVVLLPTFAADFEQIAKFDPATNGFTHYAGNPKFDDFASFEYGAGYQVFCKAASPVSVTFRGKVPTQRLSQPLAVGWHLLGSTTHADKPIAELLAGVTYSDVREHVPADNALPAASQAKAGKAYWVRVTAPSTWTPPLPKDVTTQMAYDGDGGKVKQTTASGTTIYLGEAYEKDPTGKTTKYVFAGSLRIAAKDSMGALRFYHTDHLGSSNVITDGTGALVELTEYTPYGSVLTRQPPPPAPGPSPQPGFTGQRQDTTNGLILFPARAYDPELGRFVSPDPFVQDPGDPQTLNRYSYVRNNPINLVDPSGLKWSWKKFFAIAASVVIGIVTGQLELPGIVAAAFSAATVAAATAEGAAIDRALARSASQSSPIAVAAQQGWQAWSNFATQPVVAQGASFVAGLLPFIGEVQDAAGAGTGIDIISGDRLAPWEQATSGAVFFVPFFGGVHVRHAARALNKVIQSNETGLLRRAFRYFGKSETEIVQKSGRVPNVTKEGRLKEVLLTPTEYRSSRQAEEALRAGQLDPRGPLEKLEYGVEVELKGVKLRRANAIEGGSDIEVGTYGSPRVRRIFKLDE